MLDDSERGGPISASKSEQNPTARGWETTAIILALFVSVVFFGVFVMSDSGSPVDGNAPVRQTGDQDPLAMMEKTFKGHYTREQIKGKLDVLLNLFNLPHTDEYYARCGNALRALAADSEIEEMQITDCAIRSYGAGTENMKLPEFLALSSTMLRLGEK